MNEIGLDVLKVKGKRRQALTEMLVNDEGDETFWGFVTAGRFAMAASYILECLEGEDFNRKVTLRSHALADAIWEG